MVLNFIIDCNNWSIGANKSDFKAVEDNNCIGTFASTYIIVSLNDVPEVFNIDNNSNRTFVKNYPQEPNKVLIELYGKSNGDHFPNSIFVSTSIIS